MATPMAAPTKTDVTVNTDAAGVVTGTVTGGGKVSGTAAPPAGIAQLQSQIDALNTRVTALEAAGPTPPEPIPPQPVPGDVIDARTFSPQQHAGTEADPWPGQAIIDALKSLPSTGGTVWLADGIWLINSKLQLDGVNNFTLTGQSRNAQIMFKGTCELWIGGVNFGGVSNATITKLTINAGTLAFSTPSAIRVSNARDCTFTDNQVLGHPSGSIPAMWWEGGSNNKFIKNAFAGGAQGGDSVLQVQPLGGTPNSGHLISENTFDSVALYIIGLSDSIISKNIFTNQALNNAIGIMICGEWAATSRNMTVDSNTVDARNQNDATISGLPNDPGGNSIIDGFVFTNNVVKGTKALIAAQSPDPKNYADNALTGNHKSNVTISGNQMHAEWDGAVIDLRGGGGTVDRVLVENNVLSNSANKPNVVKQDSGTTNVTIRNNTGI